MKAWGPVVVGLGGIVASFLGSLVVLNNQRIQNDRHNQANKRQFALMKSKEERDEIIKKLNLFYGPFKELRVESKILYGKFLQRRGQPFRTLRHLLEGKNFVDQEARLLTQILLINQKVLALVEQHCGVVDKPELQELLGKLTAHIRVLQLAANGELTGPADAFDDIVFPLEIDGAIESAILRLQDRLKELINTDEKEPKDSSGSLEINSTIEYYDKAAKQYAYKTLLLDLSKCYKRFTALLPRGARILDAGCGAGRDTRYFIEHGCLVIAFDASREMVRKCREYPHAYCVKLSFAEIDFKEEFDGIWACASLLHLPRATASDAMMRLTTALKPRGYMFVSVKMGKGSSTVDGRYFEYYDQASFKDTFETDARLEHIDDWQSSSVDPDASSTDQWLNVILRRRAP